MTGQKKPKPMDKAYSWTTAETMNTESMAAVRNFLFDSCEDQGKKREGLDQSAGVRLVQWGICVTGITGRVLNYYPHFIMLHAAVGIQANPSVVV